MPVSAWLVVGAFVGAAHARLVFRLVRATPCASNAMSPRQTAWILVFSITTGSVTAVGLRGATSTLSMILVAVVSSLTVLQAPLDLLTRRLSRPVTLVALVGIAVVLLLDGAISRRFDDALLAGAAATGVMCVYAFVHRAMPSALGWGDVLLVAPLTLAVGAASLEHVVTWQLVASAGAAVHGVMSRLVGAGSTIAFGPHLLLWAWLVVVLTL